MDALELPGGVWLELVPEGHGWNLAVHTHGAADRDDDATAGAAAVAARWLVDRLADDVDARQVPGAAFRVQRFLPMARPPSGERPIGVDQTNRSVVVGDRVVVKWLRRIDDAQHPALTALAHLAEVGFAGTPATFGALTWQTPRTAESAGTSRSASARSAGTSRSAATMGSAGRRVPLGFATALLPDALDGWDWCVSAFASRDLEFPAAIGRLTAQLHIAFATPSSVLPTPTTADAGVARRWHATARERLADVVRQIRVLDDAEAGPDGDQPLLRPSEVVTAQRAAMEAALDELLDVHGPTPLQRIHGDLHVGQVLRWAGGLAVIDFDGNPIPNAADQNPSGVLDPLGMASTARDVAQLMISLDQIGRIVDRQSRHTRTAEVDEWSGWARRELLAGYLGDLAAGERSELFDVRLLRPFVVEQACRDLLYSLRFLPRWAYATIEGLALLMSEDMSTTLNDAGLHREPPTTQRTWIDPGRR